MPFDSRKQQKWYHATNQTFLDDEPHSARKVKKGGSLKETDLTTGEDIPKDTDNIMQTPKESNKGFEVEGECEICGKTPVEHKDVTDHKFKDEFFTEADITSVSGPPADSNMAIIDDEPLVLPNTNQAGELVEINENYIQDQFGVYYRPVYAGESIDVNRDDILIFENKYYTTEGLGNCQFCQGAGKITVEKLGLKDCPDCDGTGDVQQAQPDLMQQTQIPQQPNISQPNQPQITEPEQAPIQPETQSEQNQPQEQPESDDVDSHFEDGFWDKEKGEEHYDDQGTFWFTTDNGHRIGIKKGQNLEDALRNAGIPSDGKDHSNISASDIAKNEEVPNEDTEDWEPEKQDFNDEFDADTGNPEDQDLDLNDNKYPSIGNYPDKEKSKQVNDELTKNKKETKQKRTLIKTRSGNWYVDLPLKPEHRKNLIDDIKERAHRLQNKSDLESLHKKIMKKNIDDMSDIEVSKLNMWLAGKPVYMSDGKQKGDPFKYVKAKKSWDKFEPHERMLFIVPRDAGNLNDAEVEDVKKLSSGSFDDLPDFVKDTMKDNIEYYDKLSSSMSKVKSLKGEAKKIEQFNINSKNYLQHSDHRNNKEESLSSNTEENANESCGCKKKAQEANILKYKEFIGKQIEVLKKKAKVGEAVNVMYGLPSISKNGRKIKGKLAYAGVSLNDRIYLPEELAKGHGRTLPLLLNHSSTAGAENELDRLDDEMLDYLYNEKDYKVGEVTLTWDPKKLTLFYEGVVENEFFQKEIDDMNMAVSLGIYYDSDSPRVCDEHCYTLIKGAEFREVSLVYHAGFPIATIEAVEAELKANALKAMEDKYDNAFDNLSDNEEEDYIETPQDDKTEFLDNKIEEATAKEELDVLQPIEQPIDVEEKPKGEPVTVDINEDIPKNEWNEDVLAVEAFTTPYNFSIRGVTGFTVSNSNGVTRYKLDPTMGYETNMVHFNVSEKGAEVFGEQLQPKMTTPKALTKEIEKKPDIKFTDADADAFKK